MMPSDAYMRHWSIPHLVQKMVCRLLGEATLGYCQLEAIGTNFSKI